jgi:hypothetical protein
MPRSGSTWTLRMLNELWATQGGRDYFEIRQLYRLEKSMTAGSALVELKLPQLLQVVCPALLGESFVVKTHSSPRAQTWRLISDLVVHRLISDRWMIPVYLIRDPRDAVLSGYEYGQRALQTGKPNKFSYTFQTIESGIDWMENYLRTCWVDWQGYDSVLLLRYENLLEDFEATTAQLLDYLGLDPDCPDVAQVLSKYRPGAEPQVGTHFHKGEIGRFRECLTPQQQEACNWRFAPYLREMGYLPS